MSETGKGQSVQAQIDELVAWFRWNLVNTVSGEVTITAYKRDGKLVTTNRTLRESQRADGQVESARDGRA